MKGVYPRGRGWGVYFKGEWFGHNENGQRLMCEFDAVAFRRHLESLYHRDPARNRYDPSRYKKPKAYRFDEAFKLYLERKSTDSGWHKAKKWTWEKYFKPYFANGDFRLIDTVQLEGFYQWLNGKGLRGKTVKNIFSVLHGFLNHFRESINSFPRFPSLSYQMARPRRFTEQEIDRVFEFIKGEDKPYFLFIRYYGVRPEEASGLLRSAIDWQNREITISTVYVNGRVKPRTKTMKERGLPIIPEIEECLMGNQFGGRDVADKAIRTKAMMGDNSPTDITEADNQATRFAGSNPVQIGSLFVFHINGKPYSRHMRERRWNIAWREAKEKYPDLRPMTLRDLRSSATSRWLRKGMLIQDVAQLLGNSPDVIRKHYSDQVENKVVEIVRGK